MQLKSIYKEVYQNLNDIDENAQLYIFARSNVSREFQEKGRRIHSLQEVNLCVL